MKLRGLPEVGKFGSQLGCLGPGQTAGEGMARHVMRQERFPVTDNRDLDAGAGKMHRHLRADAAASEHGDGTYFRRA